MIICDGLWNCMDRFGMVFGNLLIVITIFGSFVAFIRRDDVRAWLVRKRFPDVGGVLITQTEPIDAIVFLVSHTQVPSWVMRQLKPAHVGFIATQQSLSNTRTLEDEARALGLGVHGHIMIDDPDNPATTKQAVTKMISRLGDAEVNEIAVDVTGGKTPMSLGAFMAAEELAVRTIYVAADFDPALNKPQMDTARVMSISRPS